ncbi:hypothetical protein BS17DRAFT_780165 [Gyrodon lividus]|nr:hypothetical protein BS17DRAFT_780165 [Gyrodon lividus]
MQTDVINDGQSMDDRNKDIRPLIDQLLKDRGIATIDDLIAQAKAKMTPEEREQFEALIDATKKAPVAFDWTYFVAGIMMLPEGAILTGKALVAVGRFVLRIQVVQQVVKFFQIAEGGEAAAKAASEAAEAMEKAVTEAETSLEEAGEVGEAGAEIAEAASLMSKVGTFCKVLGALGFIITIISGILQAMEEAEQRSNLIDNIQGLQPARLSTAFFKHEATNITQQLELIVGYVKVLKSSPEAAKVLSDLIVNNIIAENTKIDWTSLEKELETQDKASPSYYGGADLSTEEVVKRAQSSK